MEQLRPCPFCGTSAELILIDGWSVVSCPACSLKFGYGKWDWENDKPELITAWNHRADNAKLVAALKSVAEKTLPDGTLCWCLADADDPTHVDCCKHAREALREAGEEL